jgi:predicted N-acetyltransferase YhbS
MPQPRFLVPEEFDELMELLNRVFRLDRGDRPNYLRMFKPAYRKTECGNHLVLEYGNRLVSHVGLYPRKACYDGALLEVAAIGGVGTDQNHRGRGYAGTLMAEGMRQLGLRGVDVAILWTGLKDYYEPFGFVKAGQSNKWSLPKSALKRIKTPKVTPCLYKGELLFAHSMLRLREQEPLRLERSQADFEEWLVFELNRAWFTWEEHRATSYVVIRSDYQDQGCELREWGGDPARALALLKQVSREYSGAEIRLATPPGYSALAELLQANDLEPHLGIHGHIAILSGQSTLDKYRPLLLRRAQAAGISGKFHFSAPGLGELDLDLGPGEDYHFDCDLSEFTRALFGNPDMPVDSDRWAPLEGVFPVPFWWSPLDAI